MKPAYIRVYKGSHIRYSSRINLDVACAMDFHKYPNDEQVCGVKFESFGHTTNYLRLNWLNTSHIDPNMSLKQFTYKVKFEQPYKTSIYDLEYPGT